MRIGVAGLGVMGAAVAARLMEVGHEVTVWNRTPGKTKALADAGAKVASTPAELASAVEATITMLTDAAAIDAVYNGPGGLLSGDVKGKRIAALGLTFKPDTDDLRESPSLDIIRTLQSKGAEVNAFDPVGMELASRVLKDVNFCSDAYEAAKDADAVLLLTAWNEFKHLDMERLHAVMRHPVLVDGRNIYDPEEIRELGFQYSGVGRS